MNNLGEVTADERRSLDELITLHEVEPALRDILVEGRHDARLIEWFLQRFGVAAHVLAVDDYLNVPSTAVLAIGAEVGARGRLLATATALATDASIAERVRCVVDRDMDDLLNRSWDLDPVILLTDYGSMEIYALNESCIEKFLALVRRGVDNNATARQLLDNSSALLLEVSIHRAATHLLGDGSTFPSDVPRMCDVQSLTVDFDKVAQSVCGGLRGNQFQVRKQQLGENVGDLRARIPSDPKRVMRGHDLAPVIVVLLALRGRWADFEVIEGALLGTLEPELLETEPMFRALLSWLVSPAA